MKKLILSILIVWLTVAIFAVPAAADSTIITPTGCALAFEGAIEYNVYFTVSGTEIPAAEDMGLITFDSRLENGTISDAVDIIPGAIAMGSEYLVHTNGIPAKKLGDVVYFKVYAKVADGSYVYSPVIGYSTLVYSHSILNRDSSSAEMKALMEATLEYGTKAQEYFDYNTDSPMNALLTGGGHLYDDEWFTETPATLTSPGTEYRHCTFCSNGKQTREVPQLTVSSIAVTSLPYKTTYFNQETFDPAGMEVTATLSDGSTLSVTDYTLDKDVLTADDTAVIVSFGGQTASVAVTVSPYIKVGVSQLSGIENGTTVVVEGYFVGVAEEGPSNDKEALMKDLQTDAVIALRNVPYGAFPDFGYQIGDHIRLIATVDVDGTVNTPNKRYLDFSAENGEIGSTIVSSGNEISYSLDNVVTVGSWEELQALFAIGTINEYTYVEINGPIWFNRYSGSDGVSVSRIHLNENATGVSGIRPDGTRTVSLRDNVMAANLGPDWSSLFFDQIPDSGNYPGTKLKGKLIALYTGGNNYYFQLTVLDASWVDLAEFDNDEILTEVAYAYYRQGTQIQYDQTQSRRNLNPSPEDATAQNPLYLDCSSYVNAVYQEAFAVNVLPSAKTPSTANYTAYALENLGTAEDVIGYWVNADYTTAEQISGILSQVRGLLQVGDLLVYRHGETEGSSGHVYVYVGDDTFLHCTGSSYYYADTPSDSYDKGTTVEKTGGAIQLISADDIFVNTSHTRYLFKVTASDSVYNFSLLRPMARGLTPTAESKARMRIAGLNVEKRVDIGEYNAVTLGDSITYTLTLENTTAQDLTDITLSETLPGNVTYISGSDGIAVSGQELTWSGTVSANSTVTLTYTVTADSGSLIQTEGATLGGVGINGLTNTVSGYAAGELSQVAAEAKSLTGGTFSDPIQMAITAYENALGTSIFQYTTALEVLNDVIDSDNATANTDGALAGMLVPHLYGGLDIKKGFPTDGDRSRLILEEYLAVGDIIVAEYDGISHVFLYIGDGTLLQASSTGDCALVTISGDEFTSTNILVTLLAYDRYAILRPSMTV